MPKQTFTVWYWFSSTAADGEPYCIPREIKARTMPEAIRHALIIAFSEFGARWTDNGIDVAATNNFDCLG